MFLRVRVGISLDHLHRLPAAEILDLHRLNIVVSEMGRVAMSKLVQVDVTEADFICGLFQ